MGSSLNLKGGSSTPKNIVETFSQANTFVEGDVLRYDTATSTWVKAQADSAENSEVAGVVSGSSTTSFDITYSGYISVPALAASSAPVLFLDSTTAGGLTASPPSAIGTVVKPVMTKITNGTGYIVTNYLGTQIGGSSTVAIDEIQPVGTVVPFAGSAIPDSWLECNGNSYAVGAYPYLYSKLQYTSGDRVPAYGHVAVLTTQTPVGTSFIGAFIRQGSAGTTVRAKIIAITATNITVQTVPIYSTTAKNFVVNNTVFTPGSALDDDGDTFVNITAVSITHFNTPDLRGRVALGVNTAAIPDTDTDFTVNENNSAISGIYSLGSVGGQESTVANTGVGQVGTSPFVTSVSSAGGFIANLPPYTVVRYIIKASPYTRAAIIDGIDIPYTSLLVGDLRDGTLRPGGIGEALVFKTNDGSSGTERMRLTNDGNLGIGTITPQYKFVVSNSGAEGFEFIPANISGVNIIQSYNRSGGVFNTIDFRASDYKVRVGNTELLTINSSGQVNIAATNESTSTTGGGLTLGGGLGMAKNLTVGGGISAAGGITFSGLTRLTNTTSSTTTATGALTVVGGVGVGGALFANAVQANSLNAIVATASTNTSSGALIVAGGAGIGLALNVGGGISAGGSLNVVGGISASGALTVGGGITAARLDLGSGVMNSGSITTGSFSANSLSAIVATASTNTSSGALIVAGGAGIGLALNVGGGITAARLDLGSGAIKTSGSLNCGNIVSTGTFQATSLNATDTGSGALTVVGGAGIGGALNVGGGISAADGITFSGITRVTNTTSATSTTVAALTVAGGAGIAGALYVGGGISAAGGITTAGGITMGGALNVGGVTNITNASSSTSTTSGALLVTGGVGIQGALYVGGITTAGGITMGGALTVGGAAKITNASSSTSTTSGALVVTGGAGIGGALYVGGITTAGGITMGGALTVGGAARVNSGAVSNSTTTGALIVTGGAGIGGALNVGGGISAGGGITLGTSQLAVPTGSAPIFGARAWATAYASTSTSVGLSASGNMDSVTIASGKQFTFTFTTPMPDGNYAVSVMAGAYTVGDGYAYNVDAVGPTGFSVRIGKRGDFGDPPYPLRVYVVVHR